MATFAKLPIGSIVRILKTGEFARIIGYNQMMNRPDTFLNYYVEIEDRIGMCLLRRLKLLNPLEELE